MVEKTIQNEKEVFSQRINNLKCLWNSSNSRRENSSYREYNEGSSSEQEHKVNALAQGAEEGRDKLRKATGSCK